jgi:hypothetical protein
MRVAVLLMLVAAPAAAADQFDLVCKGQWRFGASDPYEPHDFRLRIDLKAKRFCEMDCKATEPIADVQPNLIVFRQAEAEDRALGTMFTDEVDRSTGKYTYFKYSERPRHVWIQEDAICEPAPFSGFPELTKKF